MIALDAATGARIWKTYTVPETRPQGKNAIGTQLFGPSGASIWASPTIDRKSRLLYVGTGDNHSAPATETSDAVLAFSLDSGEIVWSRQLLVGDMGNLACFAADRANCPEPHGPDFDLGSSANLVTLDGGRRLLTIGQKSGLVWALDPDENGRVVWQRRVSKGGVYESLSCQHPLRSLSGRKVPSTERNSDPSSTVRFTKILSIRGNLPRRGALALHFGEAKRLPSCSTSVSIRESRSATISGHEPTRPSSANAVFQGFLQHQSQKTAERVAADCLVELVKDRSRQEQVLRCPKCLLHRPQLFIAQHGIERIEIGVGAQHEDAVELLVLLDLVGIDCEVIFAD
jgi:hypothetical protein